MLSPNEEIFFWSGIMRDHSIFIISGLSPNETEAANAADNFKSAFENLINEAKNNSEKNLIDTAFIDKAKIILESFIKFKTQLLKKLLSCSIELNYPPSFLNHMLNEANDFKEILNKPLDFHNSDKTHENIELHNLWLPDASGHAATISSDLDITEENLINVSNQFKNTFDNLSIKARELGIMLERTALENHALDELNKEAERAIIDFIEFLKSLKDAREKCEILAIGTFKPLILNHMIREEFYYLNKLRSFMK